jgi:hypothetical protein
MADPYIQSVVQDASRIGRGPMPSPAQMTQFFSQMTGIGGLFDMAGMMPKMPDRKTPIMEMLQSGERNPSFSQNLREGEYTDAGLQILGAVPFVGAPIKAAQAATRVARAKEAVGDPSQYTPKEYQERVRYMAGQFFDEDQQNLAESAVSRIADEGQSKYLTSIGVNSAKDLTPDVGPPSIAFSDLVKGGTFQQLSSKDPAALKGYTQVFNNNQIQSLLDRNLITSEEAAALKLQNATRTTRYEAQQKTLSEDPEYNLLEDSDATGIKTLPTDQPKMTAKDKETERKDAFLSKQLRDAGVPVESFTGAGEIEANILAQLEDILDRPTDSTV